MAGSLGKATVRFCGECGIPFNVSHPSRKFCCNEHKVTFNTRRITAGLRLYDAAMRWRIDRDRGALGELTGIADQLAADERAVRRAREQLITIYRDNGVSDYDAASIPPHISKPKSTFIRLNGSQQNALLTVALAAIGSSEFRNIKRSLRNAIEVLEKELTEE